jgi:hypothetical protein
MLLYHTADMRSVANESAGKSRTPPRSVTKNVASHKQSQMNNRTTMNKKKGSGSNIKTCGYCDSPEDSETKLSACSRCKLVVYCGKVCQAAYWENGHKQVCIPIADRKPNELSPQIDDGGIRATCVICLEPLKASEECTLPCSHSFHGKCVSNLRSQSTS